MTYQKKKQPKKTWYNWGALKSDEDLQKRYAVEVKNRYSALCEQTDESEVTELYGHFVDAIADTNKAILPKREKKRRDDFAGDQRVQNVRTALQQAETVYHRDPSEDSRLSVKLLKTELDQVYQDIFEEDLVAKVRRVEMAADRCKNKESWNVINEITGRKAKGATQIRGNGAEERKENWLRYFTNLSGSTPDVENEHPSIETQFEGLNISTEPFTLEELKAAKLRIKEGKAPGDDGIPPEVLKRCDLDEIVLSFCNKALTDGIAPDQWRISNIIPVPKKGDLTNPGNWRGISLTLLVAKTLNRMVLNRIQPAIEGVLRDT
ncbi:uncharacterized protein LOC134815526 [Bolinopsis microptera]|uniref:uncharacterized protein LOC134815526 n=1 Tax=Bolinopsis microptera TaxID=2820187 RepID=UPI003079E1F6